MTGPHVVKSRRGRDLDYDEPTVVAVLVALLCCPEPRRIDSLAVAIKAFVECMEAKPW